MDRTYQKSFCLTEFVFDESGGEINGFCLPGITLNKKNRTPNITPTCNITFFTLLISFSGSHLFLTAAVGIVVHNTSLQELKK